MIAINTVYVITRFLVIHAIIGCASSSTMLVVIMLSVYLILVIQWLTDNDVYMIQCKDFFQMRLSINNTMITFILSYIWAGGVCHVLNHTTHQFRTLHYLNTHEHLINVCTGKLNKTLFWDPCPAIVISIISHKIAFLSIRYNILMFLEMWRNCLLLYNNYLGKLVVRALCWINNIFSICNENWNATGVGGWGVGWGAGLLSTWININLSMN